MGLKTKIKEYKELRAGYLNRAKENYLKLEEARAKKFQIEWKADDLVKPSKLGVQVLEDFPLKN